MVVLANKKFACSTCIKGHRSSSCQHLDRPLFAIRAKGRPVSQCEHCRELRKTKQVHVKCECDNKPPPGLNPGGTVILEPGEEMITARKGARKVKTQEPQKPTFPNGITSIAEGEAILAGLGDAPIYDPSGCTCNFSGLCDCCTERYEKKGRKGHASRPSISLTIPEASDHELSSPSRSPRALSPARRGHSRSPSRSHPNHNEEGHQAGGGAEGSNGHVRNVSLYSPYSLPSSLPQDNIYSPSPSLLAPAYAYRDTSAPASPLSPDLDRPRSSLSIHTGRQSPFDITAVPSSPSAHGGVGDWVNAAMGDGMQSLNIVSQSPINPSNMFDLFGGSQQQQQQQQLSPTYRDTSPITPLTPQFFSPIESSQPSPTNFGGIPDQLAFQLGNSMQAAGYLDSSYDADTSQGDVMEAAAAALMSNSPSNRSRRASHHSATSDRDQFLLGQQAPEIRLMSASPAPPQPPSMPVADAYVPPCPKAGNGCHCYTPGGSPQEEAQRCQDPTCTCCAHLTQAFDAFGLSMGGGSSQASNFSLSSPDRDPNGPAFPMPSPNSAGPTLVDSSFLDSLQIPIGSSARSRSNSASSQASAVSSAHSHVSSNNNSAGAAALSRHSSTGHIGRSSQQYKRILPKPAASSSSGDLLSYVQPQQQRKAPSLPTSNAASSPASPSTSAFPQWQSQPQSTSNFDLLLGNKQAQPQPAVPSPPSLVVSGAGQDFASAFNSSGADIFGNGTGISQQDYLSLLDSMSGGAGVTSNQMNPNRHSRNRSTPSSFPMFNPQQQQQQQPQRQPTPGEIQLPTLPNLQQSSSQPPSPNPAHGRSQSFATATSSSGFLVAPRAQHHMRSVSASMLDGLPQLVVTAPSPYPMPGGGAGGGSQ